MTCRVDLPGEQERFHKDRPKQKVAVNLEDRTPMSTVVGQDVAMPVVLAPTGLTGMQHADGEILAARATEKAGAPSTSSARRPPLRCTIPFTPRRRSAAAGEIQGSRRSNHRVRFPRNPSGRAGRVLLRVAGVDSDGRPGRGPRLPGGCLVTAGRGARRDREPVAAVDLRCARLDEFEQEVFQCRAADVSLESELGRIPEARSPSSRFSASYQASASGIVNANSSLECANVRRN